jgi:hypothetical protein
VSSPSGHGTSLISDRNMPFCLPGSDGAGCRRQWSMTISPHVGWCGSHPSNIFPGMYRFAPSTGPTNSRGGPDGGYSIGCSIATTIVVGVGDFGTNVLADVRRDRDADRIRAPVDFKEPNQLLVLEQSQSASCIALSIRSCQSGKLRIPL